MSRHYFSVSLPDWMSDTLRWIKRSLVPPPPPLPSIDLSGSRDIEWSYIASRLPDGPGRVLDFGCGFGNLSIHAIQRNFQVLAVDLEPGKFQWGHPNLEISRGDLLKLNLPSASFDFILNCSSIEHVGIAGRYGVTTDDADGDLAAMQHLLYLLKPSGKMLLTIPCGVDTIVAPWHRVYGKARLPRLLAAAIVHDERFWMKHSDNIWYPASRDEALAFPPTNHTDPNLTSYALGCFVLSKSSTA